MNEEKVNEHETCLLAVRASLILMIQDAKMMEERARNMKYIVDSALRKRKNRG